MKTEREFFEEWHNKEYVDKLEWDSKKEEYKDYIDEVMWQTWQASAQRQGYKLVLFDHMSVIRDALVIACDSGKNYQRYEDSLNYVHKAMIGTSE